MGNKEQLEEKIVRENLWYINEETANNFSPIQVEGDSEKLDSENKIIKQRNEHLIPKSFGKRRFKRECAFVVDWQLSDSF